MRPDLKQYFENTKAPWGKLFYRILRHQIGDINGLDIVDFGSGPGITADHFAEKNNVIAIEPDGEMIENRWCSNAYRQEHGGIEKLQALPDESVDFILCHNVLEYVDSREDIIAEFIRILKPGGRISIVKHNHCGRVMHKAVFDNDMTGAMNLLDNDEVIIPYFGNVNYYDKDDVLSLSGSLELSGHYGIRTFWGLQQNNEVKHGQAWQDEMFELECRVSEISAFRDISFYEHLVLRKP